jgi:hypothetical protein
MAYDNREAEFIRKMLVDVENNDSNRRQQPSQP